MNARRTAICALTLSTLLASPAPARAGEGWDALKSLVADLFMGPETHEEFEWAGALAPGKRLEIKGINGSIEAIGQAHQVRVHALKTGRRADPTEVEIVLVEHEDGLTICAVYPSPDRTPNVCAPGDGGRMKVENNDVSVRFEIEVPPGVELVARTVNGRIVAEDLAADVKAYTVNGSVRIETQGRAVAETVNGSIQARLGRTDWDNASFSTVNGSVTLEVPDGLNSELDVSTVNGSIRSEFDLSRTDRNTRRSLRGVVGEGGRTLEVETVNGSVKLLRAGPSA